MSKQKFTDVVQRPNEVLDGVQIHHGQKHCKVYIQNVESVSGKEEKLAVIADAKTGRAYLGSSLTEQEYLHLKKTGEINLFDLNRDPQTLVMNEKSIHEAEVLTRAKNEGFLTEVGSIRRPYNVSESNTDFVGIDSNGSKIEIDIKAIAGNGKRALKDQTKDINKNIKDLFGTTEDPRKLQVICDISEAPEFLQEHIIKNITDGLDPDAFANTNFLV